MQQYMFVFAQTLNQSVLCGQAKRETSGVRLVANCCGFAAKPVLQQGANCQATDSRPSMQQYSICELIGLSMCLHVMSYEGQLFDPPAPT